MALRIFDLDETLIAADSASQFARFLVDEELVGNDFSEKDTAFMCEYNAGKLDIHQFIDFYVGAIKHFSVAEIAALQQRFIDGYIVPVIYTQAPVLLKELRQQGHTIVIISATVEFIVTAIARRLGVDHVLAIELETETDNQKGKVYNGQIKGIPSFREGKITRLLEWAHAQDETLEDAYFYSDSINDLSLLKLIDNPVATNPDVRLQQIAEQESWKVLCWEKPQNLNLNKTNLNHFTQLETKQCLD